jgi:hypothetical protein
MNAVIVAFCLKSVVVGSLAEKFISEVESIFLGLPG